ncbi:MAG: hypothetical protein ACYC3X_20505 [Pirellulaceae bacterium]
MAIVLGSSFLLCSLAANATTARAADSLPKSEDLTTVELVDAAPPPEWALWERQLLDHFYGAAVEFVQKYTREDGTLIWRDEWPGMDGSDDGYESYYNFPLYYALGGPAEIHTLARKLWDAVTGQFTRYGQIHNEFDGYYDWMHHGESYTNFYFFGLADPTVAKYRERSLRFAGLYLGEDPAAANYDAEHKLIRSPITGSRGPRFVNTAADWVTHREVLAGYPLPYDDIPGVTSSDAWIDDARFPRILEAMNQRMMRGDVPLNLTATSLVANAYMYSGEPKYRTWIEEYVTAWRERTRRNDGILPDNVGLNGQIGENMEGKWWGGYYGWRWPHGLFNQIEATLIGGANAYLVSGDPRYLELPRSVLQLVEGLARVEGGKTVVPHRYSERGWYDYRPLNPAHLVYLWYLSQDPQDRQRINTLTAGVPLDTLVYRKGKGDWEHTAAWLGFVEGRNPDYPLQILRATYAASLQRLEMIRHDQSVPADRNVHHWQERNPIVLEGLVQLMLGGPNHVYHGGLLHCRLFYFDPVHQRPGLPADVAAMVERITPDGLTVQLVNLHPTEPREMILRAGAFGEHQFTTVCQKGVTTPVDRAVFRVVLQPGACGKLDVGMTRFVNQPSYMALGATKDGE